MKTGKRLLIILLIQTGLSFVIAALFVIFYFRIFPQKMELVFPGSLALGIIFGLLFYLPIKYFLEK